MVLNGSKWLLWGLNGLWCLKLVGTRWNEVGTGYGALGLTTLTTLAIHKYTNLDPRGSQNGSKWIYLGSKWSPLSKKWMEQGGTRLEQGRGNWDWPLWSLYPSINGQIWTQGGPKMGQKWLFTVIIGSKWSMVPRNVWEKVGTEHGALRLANVTILPIHKNTKVSPKRHYWV